MKLPKTLEGQLELWLWLTVFPVGILMFYSPYVALSFGIGVFAFTVFFRQIRLQVKALLCAGECGKAEGKASLIGGFALRYVLLGIFLAVVFVTRVASPIWILAGLSSCVVFLLLWSFIHYMRENKLYRGDVE